MILRTSRYSKNLWFVSILLLIFTLLTAQFPNTSFASTGSWQQYVYNGTGGTRPYDVYTPANYSIKNSVPLIVMLHGCTQTPEDFATGTQMNALADQNQFIVVYPQQTSTYNTSSCWNWFDPADQVRGSGEPAIIAGIVQTIEQTPAQWSIDKNRVYVAGLSAGAAMSVIMGVTYPDLFAAIGVHSGLEYQAATSLPSALDAQIAGGPDPNSQGQTAYNIMSIHARVVPTIVFHGTNDTTVNPINGNQVVEQWMETDHLASNGLYDASFTLPSTTLYGQVPNGYAYNTYTWNNSKGKEIQEFWTISGMGHAWSGGNSSGSYTDPKGPSASWAIYNFFMKYTLKGPTDNS